MIILETIKELFIGLKNNNIQYCHWKSTNHLDATMKGLTDLDILFDYEMSNKIEILLLELGFKRFETVHLRSYPGIHDYICLDNSGVWVHLHLHYILNLGDRWVKAYRFPIEREILSRVQYLSEYNTYIINPFDELMLFGLRMSLKFRSPYGKKSVSDELNYLKERCDNTEPVYKDILSYFNGLKVFLDYVLSSSTLKNKSLNKFSRIIAKELSVFRRFGLIRFNYLSWKRKIYRYYIEFRRRFLSNFKLGRRKIVTGGKIIAVVGIDGSGKTSTLGFIEKFFAIQMNTSKVFLGNGQSGASWYRKIIFSIYGTKAKFKNKKSSFNKDDSKIKVSPLYALWILICLIDKEKNLKRAIANKANGGLVLSDRWPQREVKGTFDGSRINVNNPKNFIVKYVKKREQRFLQLSSLVIPDLVIRLRISPATSLLRKPGELTSIQAKTNSDLLNNINWSNASTIDIDGDKPQNEVKELVKSNIWKLIKGNQK